jgi:hypothetical protein
MLAVIRREAAAHSIPAVLTGGRVLDGPPGKDAGLYHDPAGEPGVREWTGTHWSPFLQVDPGTGGNRDEETGLSRIWSPLSAAVLHRQSRAVLRKPWGSVVAWVVLWSCFGLLLILSAVPYALGDSADASDVLDVALGAAGGTFLVSAPVFVQEVRQRRRIALALRADAVRASAEDDPPVTATTPGSWQ